MDRGFAEAARIDGAGELPIFFRSYLPMARPLIALVAVFSIVGVWDDFLWPLVVSTSEKSTTVQLAITVFASTGNVKYGVRPAARTPRPRARGRLPGREPGDVGDRAGSPAGC